MKHRVISILLALLLMASMLSGALAAEKQPDFSALLKAGEAPGSEVLLITEPTSRIEIQSLVHNGAFFAYRNPKTERYGLCDAFGTVYWELPEGKMFAEIFPNGYTMVENDLYDLAGKKVNEDKLYYSLTPMKDRVTGEEKWLGVNKMDKNGLTVYTEAIVGYDGRVLGMGEYGEIWNGKLPYQDTQTKKWGIRKPGGEVILAPKYDFLAFLSKDILLCCENGLYGTIKADGTQVFACKYKDFSKAGLVGKDRIIVQDSSGKWGVITHSGKQIVPFQYDTIWPVDAVVNPNSQNAEGKLARFSFVVLTREMQYYSYYTESSAWAYRGSKEVPEYVAPVGSYWSVSSGDGTYQLVDNDGQAKISGSYAAIEANDKGYLLKDFNGTGKSRFYDTSLKLVWEKSGTDCRIAADLVVFTKDSTSENSGVEVYGLDGTLIQSIQGAEYSFSLPCACVLKKGEKYALLNHDGNVITGFEYGMVHQLSEAQRSNLVFLVFDGFGIGKLFDTGSWTSPLGEDAVVFMQDYPRGTYGTFQRNNVSGVFYHRTESDGPFLDTKASAWFAEAVTFCQNAGLMNGTGHGKFEPKKQMTRAMLVQVLYNVAGEKTASQGFTDVPDGKWYSDAVNWAASKGIVNGVTSTQFKPNAYVTREQMVTILQRFAKKYTTAVGNPEVLNTFTDAGSISSYAKDAMAWAVENGILTGKTDTTLDPKGNATRAEIATVLMRFIRLMAN